MTFSFLQSLQEAGVNSLQADLKNADSTDAGKADVSNKAHSTADVNFSTMRNVINSEGEITGSDVADYIERAEELNDEIDTIAYGLETDDGHVVKVYVNAEQSEDFEEALRNMLGVEEDIEETLNRLAAEYDIVDVVWPEKAPEDGDHKIAPNPDDAAEGDGPLPGDMPNAAALQQVSHLTPVDIAGGNDEDEEDEDYEVIAALPDDPQAPSDSATDPDALPDVQDTDEGSAWEKLNDAAVEKFGNEEDSEVLGLRDLNAEQLGELIDLDLANEIAANQYVAADFMSLEEDEQKEIIDANPNLIKGEDEDDEKEDKSTSDDPDGNDPNETESEVEAEEDNIDDTDVESNSTVPESRQFSFLKSLM